MSEWVDAMKDSARRQRSYGKLAGKWQSKEIMAWND